MYVIALFKECEILGYYVSDDEALVMKLSEKVVTYATEEAALTECRLLNADWELYEGEEFRPELIEE